MILQCRPHRHWKCSNCLFKCTESIQRLYKIYGIAPAGTRVWTCQQGTNSAFSSKDRATALFKVSSCKVGKNISRNSCLVWLKTTGRIWLNDWSWNCSMWSLYRHRVERQNETRVGNIWKRHVQRGNYDYGKVNHDIYTAYYPTLLQKIQCAITSDVFANRHSLIDSTSRCSSTYPPRELVECWYIKKIRPNVLAWKCTAPCNCCNCNLCSWSLMDLFRPQLDVLARSPRCSEIKSDRLLGLINSLVVWHRHLTCRLWLVVYHKLEYLCLMTTKKNSIMWGQTNSSKSYICLVARTIQPWLKDDKCISSST